MVQSEPLDSASFSFPGPSPKETQQANKQQPKPSPVRNSSGSQSRVPRGGAPWATVPGPAAAVKAQGTRVPVLRGLLRPRSEVSGGWGPSAGIAIRIARRRGIGAATAGEAGPGPTLPPRGTGQGCTPEPLTQGPQPPFPSSSQLSTQTQNELPWRRRTQGAGALPGPPPAGSPTCRVPARRLGRATGSAVSGQGTKDNRIQCTVSDHRELWPRPDTVQKTRQNSSTEAAGRGRGPAVLTVSVPPLVPPGGPRDPCLPPPQPPPAGGRGEAGPRARGRHVSCTGGLTP